MRMISGGKGGEFKVYLILIIYNSEGKKRFSRSVAYYRGGPIAEDLCKDPYAPQPPPGNLPGAGV